MRGGMLRPALVVLTTLVLSGQAVAGESVYDRKLREARAAAGLTPPKPTGPSSAAWDAGNGTKCKKGQTSIVELQWAKTSPGGVGIVCWNARQQIAFLHTNLSNGPKASPILSYVGKREGAKTWEADEFNVYGEKTTWTFSQQGTAWTVTKTWTMKSGGGLTTQVSSP
jgi:hypothetical protein